MPDKLISEILNLPDRVQKGDFVVNLAKGVTEPEVWRCRAASQPLARLKIAAFPSGNLPRPSSVLRAGKRSENDDRRRVARSLTVDEMRRLLDQARRRTLEDALRVTRGPNAGALTAKLSPERRAALERLGCEREWIYKTAILTGLRLNELRTLRVGDLSFGDVPFVALRSANEKNRKGSTTPLREDLADDLRKWIAGKGHDEPVFDVPSGLLRILNRDLVAAGIDKIDDRG